MTAVHGDLVLNQSHLQLHFASTTGHGTWTWHCGFPYRQQEEIMVGRVRGGGEAGVGR